MASAADVDVCWPSCDLSSVTGSQNPLLQAPTRVRCMYVCVCYRRRPWMALMGDVWQACCRHPSLSDVCNCCGGEAERWWRRRRRGGGGRSYTDNQLCRRRGSSVKAPPSCRAPSFSFTLCSAGSLPGRKRRDRDVQVLGRAGGGGVCCVWGGVVWGGGERRWGITFAEETKK